MQIQVRDKVAFRPVYLRICV